MTGTESVCTYTTPMRRSGGVGGQGAGTVVEVSELVSGDVEGVGGEIEAVVGAGAAGGGDELTEDGVESGDADVAGVVFGGASPKSVDVGSEVEWVRHGIGALGARHVCSSYSRDWVGGG